MNKNGKIHRALVRLIFMGILILLGGRAHSFCGDSYNQNKIAFYESILSADKPKVKKALMDESFPTGLKCQLKGYLQKNGAPFKMPKSFQRDGEGNFYGYIPDSLTAFAAIIALKDMEILQLAASRIGRDRSSFYPAIKLEFTELAVIGCPVGAVLFPVGVIFGKGNTLELCVDTKSKRGSEIAEDLEFQEGSDYLESVGL